MIRSYRGIWPKIAASAYVDPAAVIIGDVTIGEHSSVWPGVVIRGDVHWIRIGGRSNVQDGSVLHVMKNQYPLLIGDNVTVGHGVMLHGCTVESRVLVGMGSIVLNDARIGEGSIIAAGTLVPEHTVVQPGSLFLGHPGKFRCGRLARRIWRVSRCMRRGMWSMRRFIATKPCLVRRVLAEGRLGNRERAHSEISGYQGRAGYFAAGFGFVESRGPECARGVWDLRIQRDTAADFLSRSELFTRSIGAETDIVGKELFSWEEGGTPIESELPKIWMLKHLSEFDRIDRQPVFANRARPDLVVQRESEILVVKNSREGQ